MRVHAMIFYTTVCGFDLLTDVDSTLESGDLGEIFMLLSFNLKRSGSNFHWANDYYAVKLASNFTFA